MKRSLATYCLHSLGFDEPNVSFTGLETIWAGWSVPRSSLRPQGAVAPICDFYGLGLILFQNRQS